MHDFVTNTGTSRRTFLKTSGLLLTTLAGVPLLASCGTDSDKAAAPSSAGQSEGPVKGGTLRLGAGGSSSTDTLDPHNAVNTISIATVAQFAETLLRYDKGFKVIPHLALKVEPNDTATEWTITLRDGVTFHDGKPLTSDDVVYTFKKILSKDSPGAAASQLEHLQLDKVKATDKLTLVVPFAEPFAAFPDALAMAATSAIRVVPRGFDLAKPIGTGPFKYVSFTPGQQAKFTRNDTYWVTGQPYLDAVEITAMNDDAARVNALIAGQVDAITSVPAGNAAVLKANAKLKLLVSESGSWNPIVMRTDIAPFDDVRVRQAFRLIADRDELVKSALAGEGSVANDLFGRYDQAYSSGLAQRKKDIAKAKELLQAAGQSDLKVQLVTSKIAEGIVGSAQVFAQQAAAAGVTVEVLEVQPTDFWSKHFLNAPFTHSNWATRNYLMQASDSMLPKSPYNETHWANDTWFDLVEKAMATADEAKRSELIRQAQQIEYDEGGYINWGWYNSVDAYSASLNGFVPDASGISLTTFRFGDVWKSA